jgi:hypothetical protein
VLGRNQQSREHRADRTHYPEWLKILVFVDGNEHTVLSLGNNHSLENFLTEMWWNVLYLPIIVLADSDLRMGYVSAGTRFERIVRAPKGMLGNVGCRHGLACGTGSETRGTPGFGITSGCMGGKRRCANIGHLKYACTNPGSACFNGVTRSVVIGVGLLKQA